MDIIHWREKWSFDFVFGIDRDFKLWCTAHNSRPTFSMHLVSEHVNLLMPQTLRAVVCYHYVRHDFDVRWTEFTSSLIEVV